MTAVEVMKNFKSRILQGRVRQDEVSASMPDSDRVVITVTAEQLVLAAWGEHEARHTITDPNLDTITISSPFGSHKFTRDEVHNILAVLRLRGKL